MADTAKLADTLAEAATECANAAKSEYNLNSNPQGAETLANAAKALTEAYMEARKTVAKGSASF